MPYQKKPAKHEKIESYEQQIKRTRLKRIQSLLNRPGLTKEQKETMQRFYGWLQRKGLRLESQKAYLQNLFLLFRDMKSVLDPSKKYIDDYLALVSQQYKPKTETERRKFLILFYEWYYDKKHEEIELLKDVSVKKSKGLKLPDELLIPEEIKKITQVADNFRDKAIIMLLYETACRKGEFLKLCIKHVELEESKGKKYGFITIPLGKTDSRKIPLIYSLPYVINWLNSHPNRDDPNNPLFITLGSYLGQSLGEDGLKMLVKRLGRRAGIKKNIYPHLFRHSRLTELAKELTEQELKIFAGWTPDSNMASVYVHLSGNDVSNKILANAGLIDSNIIKKGQKILMQIECPGCHKLNPSDTKYCSCGKVLDLNEAQKLIDKREKDKDSVRKELQELREQQRKIMVLIAENVDKRIKE